VDSISHMSVQRVLKKMKLSLGWRLVGVSER
jgi:hypothetical protein